MIPKDSVEVKSAFKSHFKKQETFLWFLGGVLFWEEAFKNPEFIKEELDEWLKLKPEEREERLVEVFKGFDKIVEDIEIARQKGIYVGCLKKEGKTHSPQSIEQEKVEKFLNIVEHGLGCVIEATESEVYKYILRKFFESFPKESLKTSELPSEWFNNTDKMEESK